MIISIGTEQILLVPYTIIATGWFFDSSKIFLVLNVLQSFVAILSAAITTPCSFITNASEVMLCLSYAVFVGE